MSLRLNYVDSRSADNVGQKITPPRVSRILSASGDKSSLKRDWSELDAQVEWDLVFTS